MKTTVDNIEDLLEVLAGLCKAPKMEINPTDATIMHSIARQTAKGTALTDRQHVLMSEKLQDYKEQFESLDYDFDTAITKLRQPLRQIDRRKYIKLVTTADMMEQDVYESYKKDWKWIKIRFPFSKKLIMHINDLQKDSNEYYHKKGSHEHFFRLSERNAYNIVQSFTDKNFEIDEELLEIYKQLEALNLLKDEHIPGVYQGELKNLPDNAVQCINEYVIDKNLVQYYDRRYLFGLLHFDEYHINQALFNVSTLSANIAKRKSSNIVIRPSKYSLNDLVQTLLELNRFPLLVILDDNDAIGGLSELHYCLKNIIPSKDMSVMFRLDSKGGDDFNRFIKENNLNNLVAKNTKVVYINSNKVPKPLVNSGWKPSASLRFRSDMHHLKMPSKYVEGLDLKLEYTDSESLIGSYGLRKRYETV